MEYVKHEVERLIGYPVKVHLLFHFIHKFTQEAGYQNVRTERQNDMAQFESQWKAAFPSSLTDCILVHSDREPLSLAKLCCDSELMAQVPWSIFITCYQNGAIPIPSANCNSTHIPPAQPDHPPKDYVPVTPMNFEQLVQISFWEQLYDLYGNHIVRFVFKKCLLVLPIEESLFLAVCSKNTMFNKGINEYSKYVNHRNQIKRTHSPVTRGRPGNPYEYDTCAAAAKKRKVRKTKLPEPSRRERKRSRIFTGKRDLEMIEGDVNEHVPLKKRRLGADADVVDDSSSRTKDPLAPSVSNLRLQESASASAENKSEGSITTTSSRKCPWSRWITPSSTVIRSIREARDSLKAKGVAELPTASPSRPPTGTSTEAGHTFVNIMKDKYFKGKLSLITKETHFIVVTEELPKKLAGLVLPKAVSSSVTPVEITVHRMSETAAKELGLRVIPKKRRRRKNAQKAVSISIFSKSSGMKSRSGVVNPEADPVLGHSTVGQLKMDKPVNKSHGQWLAGSVSHPQPYAPPISNGNIHSTAISDKPFEPTVPLTTSSIVNFHCSGNQFPGSCDMGQACLLQAESRPPQESSIEGIGSLLSKVLYSPVVCRRDKEKWKSSVENLEKAGHLKKLEVILKEMVQFHRRARDLNKLMKNCVCFWIWKLSVKDQIRQERKQAAEACKAERRKQKLQRRAQEQEQLVKKRPEVIDLTVDTSGSTTFSGTGSQPPNVSVILTSSSSGHRDSSHNHSATRPNPDPPSFLSTTPNRSHSQRERQKLAFAKLKESIPHACILSSLSQILFLSGACKLLDSNANRRGFLSFVRKSVFLAGKKSALHLGQLMAMVNPDNCSWLSDINDAAMKTHLLAKVVHWLYNEYVLVIMRTCFYSTEISNCRFQMTFYLRDTWRSISDRLKHQLLKKGSLVHVRRTEAEYKLPANARMRLVPKQNLRIRPILCLEPSVNQGTHISQCRLLLNYVCGNLAPHGICDTSSFLQTWKKFLNSWRRRKGKPLYYIRLDIRDAYPSVKIDKLKEILLETCSSEDQLTAKRFTFIGRKTQARVSLTKPGVPNINWYTSLFRRPSILKDAEADFRFNKGKIVQFLITTLTSNVIQMGKQKFTFAHGLPQGWCLSQALCNLYYGHMDKKYFSRYLNDEDECFLRSVDDYFYVSPIPGRIAAFFHRMKCGLPDYNCHINPDKSLTNIFAWSNVPAPLSDWDWVRFCGWRFCLASGHIARDFTSYAGADFCSTLTFLLKRAKSPEDFIYRRMGMVAPVRLKLLVLDPSINCRERILITIYESGLVMAFRFYAACRVVYSRLTSVADPAKGNHLFQAITWCALSLSRFVCRNTSHFYTEENLAFHKCYLSINGNGSASWSVVPQSTPTSDQRRSEQNLCRVPKCGDPITPLEVSFLVYQAFRKKLLIHASNFNNVILPKLDGRIHTLKKRLKNRSHYMYLNRIIGKKMPPHFCDIKI